MYPNLKAAWIGLMIDNIPAQIRPSDDIFEQKVVPGLLKFFTSIQLSEADVMLNEYRSYRPDEDITNIDSMLWAICCGNDELINSADPLINEVLNEMFNRLEMLYDQDCL